MLDLGHSSYSSLNLKCKFRMKFTPFLFLSKYSSMIWILTPPDTPLCPSSYKNATHYPVQSSHTYIRVHPRFFDQVGHQNTNASIRNKYIFTNIFIVRLTYQNYEQSRQKLSTFLLNKVPTLKIKVFKKFH